MIFCNYHKTYNFLYRKTLCFYYKGEGINVSLFKSYFQIYFTWKNIKLKFYVDNSNQIIDCEDNEELIEFVLKYIYKYYISNKYNKTIIIEKKRLNEKIVKYIDVIQKIIERQDIYEKFFAKIIYLNKNISFLVGYEKRFLIRKNLSNSVSILFEIDNNSNKCKLNQLFKINPKILDKLLKKSILILLVK